MSRERAGAAARNVRVVRQEEDISHHFAELVAAASYDDLGDEAVTAAKKSILDTVGVIMAAGGLEPAVQPCIDVVREAGGRAEASILGEWTRVPAVSAAFANGTMAHCLDYDDRTPWGQHSGSSIVPAVLAIAERQAVMGAPVSGAEIIVAVAVGQDVFARLRQHTAWQKDWNMSTVLGVYAATAGGARVGGLSAEQTQNAFGIASQESGGVHEVVTATGSNLRGLYAGFPAKGAVLATLLAGRGVTGVDRLFEGSTGIFPTYFGSEYDRVGMLANIGTDFRGRTTLYKIWPAVGTSHNHVHATIMLMAQHGISSEQIQEIRLHVGDYHRLMCMPLEERRSPATVVDAKFSLPFIVASAAVRRGLKVSDFSPAALHDPQVEAMAGRVRPIYDAELDWGTELPPAKVEIVTRAGHRYERAERAHPGSVESPLTWDEIVTKFVDCVSASRQPVDVLQAGRFVQAVRDLEELEEVGDLLNLLLPQDPPPGA